MYDPTENHDNVLYYKFDWINDVDGTRYQSNEDILDYQYSMLDIISNYNFNCIKVRPRGFNWHADMHIATAFLDRCYILGFKVFLDLPMALAEDPEEGMSRNWGMWEVSEPIITHPAVVAITIMDEPSNIGGKLTQDILHCKDQYDYLRAYTDKALTTAYIGEYFDAADTDPYSEEADARSSYVPKFVEYSKPDFFMARHYPIRRDRGVIHNAYEDKMVLSYPKFIEELSEYSQNYYKAIPILQGFGKGISRTASSADYWSLPTLYEMQEMVRIAKDQFTTIAVYRTGSLPHHLKGEVSLIDVHGEPTKALDGSYPIDAFA